MHLSFLEIPSEVQRLCDFSSFIDLFEKSKRVAVLTGAGVSTLSGIPDFRSSDGLYSKKYGHMSVEALLDIQFFRAHPDEFYSWAKDNWYRIDEKEPNIIHKTLSRLEAMNMLSEGIFTQNIDALHQKAGSKKVYELHGSLSRGFCMNCNAYYTYSDIAEMVHKNMVPVCRACGGVIKPDIVFYGEGLDMSILKRAEIAFSNADLAIVLGSSLVVNPAASLPYISARNGHNVVIVNRDSTYMDDIATMIFRDLNSFFVKFSEYLDSRSNHT